jgi:hypothetical protein
MMNWKRRWKVVAYSRSHAGIFLHGPRKTKENLLIEIRAEHLPNTSFDRYDYANWLVANARQLVKSHNTL